MENIITSRYIKILIDEEQVVHFIKTGSKTDDLSENLWFRLFEDAYNIEPYKSGIELFRESDIEKTYNIKINTENISTDGIDYLQNDHKDLLDFYSGLTYNDLLNQIGLEVKDLHNSDERVSVFMETCTNNMSNTNYTPESIKSLVQQKQELDISDFCRDLLDDCNSAKELIETIKNNIIN